MKNTDKYDYAIGPVVRKLLVEQWAIFQSSHKELQALSPGGLKILGIIVDQDKKDKSASHRQICARTRLDSDVVLRTIKPMIKKGLVSKCKIGSA